MNNHPVWKEHSHHLTTQKEQPLAYTGIQKAVTTVCTLALGYYVLHFFDAWPSTIQRSLYEIIIYLIPSQAIYGLQSIMARYGRLPDDIPRFRRTDFGNQQAKAEVVQRMLGHSALPSALRKAKSLSGIDTILPQPKDPGPPGLGNWDNSCYQNSVLQGLASMPAFMEFVDQGLTLCDNLELPATTHRALRLFLAQLSDVTRRQTTIWTPSVLKSMDSWQQQDAQEYFSRVIEALEKESQRCSKALNKRASRGFEPLTRRESGSAGILDRLSLEDSSVEESDSTPLTSPTSQTSFRTAVNVSSLPKSPIDGSQAQALKCQTCGFSEGATLTPFSCLTLNLGLRGPSYLEDLLDDYTEPEIVEDVECTECTKALADGRDKKKGSDDSDSGSDVPSPSKRPKLKSVLRNKAKQLTICRLPKDLVLHINRSIFDDWGESRKNTSPISFPNKLEFVSKWCIPLSDDDDDERVEAVYELQCVVTHHGRHENGHYVAFAKRGKGWYCFNDEIVTPVSEADVLSRGNVFMLFYEAVNIDTTIQNGGEEIVETKQKASSEPGHVTRQPDSSTSSSDTEPVIEPKILSPVQPVPLLRTASGSIQYAEPSGLTTPTIPAV
jgi:ubiquitin carboxyl-terminal hydrolase 1